LSAVETSNKIREYRDDLMKYRLELLGCVHKQTDSVHTEFTERPADSK